VTEKQQSLPKTILRLLYKEIYWNVLLLVFIAYSLLLSYFTLPHSILSQLHSDLID